MTSTRARRSRQIFLGVVAALAFVQLISGCSSAPTKENSQANPETGNSSFCEPATAIEHAAPTVASPTQYLERKKFILTLTTNCGEIQIEADAEQAPATVTAIGHLANAKYFDSTLCHRLTTSGIFVLQCGDPTASGSGGPGFTFADENLPTAGGVNYPKGTVAMANSGPNTNGSQFFLVYADTTLAPNYSIWGTVTKGIDLLEKIAAIGTSDGGPDGAPKYPIEIRTARLQ